MFKLVFEDKGARDQIANIRWIIKKAREFQNNIYFCFIDYAESFHCVDQNKLWVILKEMGIPDHLICFLRNLYAGQEATVRTERGITDWFQIGKGVHQGCILSHCFFFFSFPSFKSFYFFNFFFTLQYCIGFAIHQHESPTPCLFNLYAEYIMRNADWMKHKLESRLPGEISITSDTQKVR